jgi:hypothetical protein
MFTIKNLGRTSFAFEFALESAFELAFELAFKFAFEFDRHFERREKSLSRTFFALKFAFELDRQSRAPRDLLFLCASSPSFVRRPSKSRCT